MIVNERVQDIDELHYRQLFITEFDKYRDLMIKYQQEKLTLQQNIKNGIIPDNSNLSQLQQTYENNKKVGKKMVLMMINIMIHNLL
eukprot:UN07633